ncbi:MAG: helix-turn-helix domain-containing protein [Thermoanaerobacterium thermosaccharolyticum]|jgi:IS30 family transposase
MCYPASFIQTIQRLYFCEHKKVKEIAESLNCSTDTVTRIIKKDVRYDREKESRRNNSKEKQNKLKKGKREEDNMLMEALKRQQEIHATVILSKKRKLGTDTLIEMSITHYDYNPHNQKLIFNEACGRKPVDLPRTIKVHKSTLNQFVQYSQNIESEKWTSNVEKKALK